jgi:uncharacterized protein (DUF1778 family)
MDEPGKRCLEKAAKLRGISISAYVRIVAVPQAKREIEAVRDGTIVVTSEEQRAFWRALNKKPLLTESQRRLGTIMRGEEGPR